MLYRVTGKGRVRSEKRMWVFGKWELPLCVVLRKFSEEGRQREGGRRWGGEEEVKT